MMRAVVFDISGILEAFDYRGVLIHKQEIQANEKVKLPFTQKNLFKFNGVFFGVCEGVGDLDYRDYPKNLNFNVLLIEQVELSLKGIVRILEVLLSLDFFKNANEIDSSLRNSIEWLSNAGDSLKLKMKEYEGFFSDFNTSMKANEQEVTNILNANTENIKSEIKKLENQLIETTTKLLTSYQIFLNQARENATNQINTNKTQSLEAIKEAKTSANNEINTNKTASLEAITQAKTTANNEITANQTQAINNINEAKVSANNEINTNKQEVLNNITQAKTTATSEINEAKKAIIIKTLIFLRLNKAC